MRKIFCKKCGKVKQIIGDFRDAPIIKDIKKNWCKCKK